MEYAVREGMICAKLGTMVKKLVEEDLMPPECSIPFESEILLGIGISCQRLDRRGIIYKMAMSAGDTNAREGGKAKAATAGSSSSSSSSDLENKYRQRRRPRSLLPSPHLPTGIELSGPRPSASGSSYRNGTERPVKRESRSFGDVQMNS